jgi:hypothetical protein
VDLLGYAFSWVLLALPTYVLLGSDFLQVLDARQNGYTILAIAVVLVDVHRHFTFPYVYLNRRLRQQLPLRFWLLPALCVLLLTRLPFWSRSSYPLGLAEVSAIGAWVVVLVQLLRVDRIGGVARRRALATALSAGLVALVSILAAELPPGPSLFRGWMALLCAAVASFAIARMPASTRSAMGGPVSRLDAWIPPAALLVLAVGALPSRATVTVNQLVSVVILVYVLWLAFHVITQKYGILRIYSAKSGQQTKVPRWVDRAVVWCWVPMVIAWTVIHMPSAIVEDFETMTPGSSRTVAPLLQLLAAHPQLWLAAASVPIVAGFGAFLYYEWTIHRLRNAPRLAYAAGTGLLYATLFWIGPVGLYVAFAATHCLEYLTFLWALQRQRYPRYDADAPLLSSMIQRPVLYYGGLTLFVGSLFFVARYAAHYLQASPEVFGLPLAVWAFWYSILQAFLHFYYDGFLWKMRPELTRVL